MSGTRSSLLSPRWCLVGIVMLGLGLRTYHYARNPPMWHDEAAQVINILGKNFGEQLGPLYYSEASPPLFMWLEKTVVLALGDDTYALRLVPWLASCLAFLGLLWIGRQLLSWPALLWLGLLFACSDRLLWHCCEAKPYAVDVLVAVGLLAFFVHYWQNRTQENGDNGFVIPLILLTCISPWLLWLSFPACFLLGGMALCVLPSIGRSKKTAAFYGLFLVVLLMSFLALYLGPIRAQKAERLMVCWQSLFPNWHEPGKTLLLTGQRLTEVFRYACEPVGNLLSVLAVVGGVQLWRRGEKRLLAFLVWPLALATLAWWLGHYVIGPTRVMVFMAPAALVLIALGTPPTLAWLRARLGLLGPPMLMGLLVFPCGQALYRLAMPWPRSDSTTAAAFVLEHRQPHEAVVGTQWEHTYYFRTLGSAYRRLAPIYDEPPTPPPTLAFANREDGFVGALWLVGMNDINTPQKHLEILKPHGKWVENKRYDFAGVTVLHLKRRPKE